MPADFTYAIHYEIGDAYSGEIDKACTESDDYSDIIRALDGIIAQLGYFEDLRYRILIPISGELIEQGYLPARVFTNHRLTSEIGDVK